MFDLAWKRKKRCFSYRKRRIRRRLTLAAICVALIGYGVIRAFNEWIEPQLQVVARQQSSIALNNITTRIIASMTYDSRSLVRIERDEQGYITTLDVDTNALNELLYEMLQTVDASLEAAQEGKNDPTLDQTLYETGVLYQLPLGYLTHLPFLSSVGPKIDIRFRMMNDVRGYFRLNCEPYGLNNTLLRLDLVIELKAEVLTVLSISEYAHTIELPIVMEIIHGQVPQAYQNWTSPSMQGGVQTTESSIS